MKEMQFKIPTHLWEWLQLKRTAVGNIGENMENTELPYVVK